MTFLQTLEFTAAILEPAANFLLSHLFRFLSAGLSLVFIVDGIVLFNNLKKIELSNETSKVKLRNIYLETVFCTPGHIKSHPLRTFLISFTAFLLIYVDEYYLMDIVGDVLTTIGFAVTIWQTRKLNQLYDEYHRNNQNND